MFVNSAKPVGSTTDMANSLVGTTWFRLNACMIASAAEAVWTAVSSPILAVPRKVGETTPNAASAGAEIVSRV